ncbi:MAG TPA: LacI family DNA-binding transcriptional regulator [Anaerolineales bacterium]|nr:LacI family DNA-binding transcriptional regulator [Anaerolineales bacterium]
MKNSRSITIKELALRAGVSHSTVSRALNNHPALARGTVERIQQLAQELNYVPSGFARSLKTNRSYMLGVIVHRIADPFYSEVLAGIQNVAHQFQYSMFVSAFESDMERQDSLIRGVLGRQADALIIGDSFFTSEHVDELSIRVPAVFIHNRAEVLPHSIYHDDINATRALTRHLLDLGHRRVAFGGNQRGGLLHQQRREGVVTELESAGLELRREYDLLATDGQMSSGAWLAKQLLEMPERPTAIICYNDMQAIGVMQTLQQANLRIPEDISVTGFDDIPLAEFLYPALTTYSQPIWELGQMAARVALCLLGENVNESLVSEPFITMHGRLIVRRSTAAPATEAQVEQAR